MLTIADKVLEGGHLNTDNHWWTHPYQNPFDLFKIFWVLILSHMIVAY